MMDISWTSSASDSPVVGINIEIPENVQRYIAALDERKREIGRLDRYRKRIADEYNRLSPYLPSNIRALVDIGCGLGGIDIPICRFHHVESVHLIDGDGRGQQKQLGYSETVKAWSDVHFAVKMVSANNQNPHLAINHFYPASLPRKIPCDCLISMKSWGHHYPISIYLEFVRQSLIFDGTLVVDIRKGTDGAEQLRENGFTMLTVWDETPKCHRMVFKRVGA